MLIVMLVCFLKKHLTMFTDNLLCAMYVSRSTAINCEYDKQDPTSLRTYVLRERGNQPTNQFFLVKVTVVMKTIQHVLESGPGNGAQESVG